jgi:hypothetical protein
MVGKEKALPTVADLLSQQGAKTTHYDEIFSL